MFRQMFIICLPNPNDHLCIAETQAKRRTTHLLSSAAEGTAVPAEALGFALALLFFGGGFSRA